MSHSTHIYYSASARALHWLTVILVGAAFLLSEGGPPARVFGAANASGLMLHESLGMGVFIVTLARMIWRMADPAPAPVPMPAWMHLASTLTHWALYALLILVPLTAITGSWSAGHPVFLYGFGAITGPALFGGWNLLSLHTWLGDAIIWVAGLHAAAALYHHFWLKDDVLRAMLPPRRV